MTLTLTGLVQTLCPKLGNKRIVQIDDGRITEYHSHKHCAVRLSLIASQAISTFKSFVPAVVEF